MANLQTVTIDDTGHLALPSGTTAQRTVSPSNGAIRYSSTLGRIERYKDGWEPTTLDKTIVTRGLVWNLDAASYSGSGAWQDLSASANHTVVTGSPTYSTEFGGYFNISNGATQNFRSTNNLTFTNQMSVEVWFRSSPATSEYARIFQWNDTILSQGSYAATEPYQFRNWFNAGGGRSTEITVESYACSLDNWHHAIMCYNGSEVFLFFDGYLVDKTTHSGNLQSAAQAAIGEDFYAPSYPWSGDIAVCRVYDRGLSPDECLQNFNATCERFRKEFAYTDPPIVTHGLIALFDGANPQSLRNGSNQWTNVAGTNHAELQNSPSYSFRRGGYLSFNGSNQTAICQSLIKSYPYTLSIWARHNNAFSPSSGMQEMMNFSMNGQRISHGVVVNSGWVTGPTLMYGGTSHYSGPAAYFQGRTSEFFNITFVVYGSNDNRHRVYINGSELHMTDNGGGHGGSAGWGFGSNSAGGEWWPGAIAHISLYDRTLTSYEIQHNVACLRARYGVG